MRKITKKDQREYLKYLAIYLKTKDGQWFAFHIISQLIDGFEVDHQGWIKKTILDDENPLVIDFTDEKK